MQQNILRIQNEDKVLKYIFGCSHAIILQTTSIVV